MGPELTLAIVGVALARPGVATAFRDVGTLIVKRLDTIKNAPEIILELRQVGRAVCKGRLQACIDIAEHAFDRDDLNQALRADLTRGLEQMRKELVNIDNFLQKLIKDNDKVSKVKTMLPPRWT
jgi:phosphoglycerate-specific signal transduction histidine kinase